MNIKTRINIQIIRAILILLVILIQNLQSASVKAQGLKKFVKNNQFGFEGTFGIKTFNLSSDIEAINGLNVVEEGGSIGVAMGAKAFRVKLRQGYYYSSAAVAHTVDEVRSAFVVNFYPFQLISGNNSGLQPYFTGGIEHNILKMYGAYGSENTRPRNYSVSEAPYLGKISSVVASFGGGLEYGIKNPGHFVNFFAEARYGKSINTPSSSALFHQTSASNQLLFNIGVGFGYCR